MVLHGGDQDFVARADVLPAPGLRHQVDAFRRAPHVNDFAVVGGIQEPLQLDPRILISLCGALAEQVDPAVNVGVVLRVILH